MTITMEFTRKKDKDKYKDIEAKWKALLAIFSKVLIPNSRSKFDHFQFPFMKFFPRRGCYLSHKCIVRLLLQANMYTDADLTCATQITKFTHFMSGG